MFYSSSERFFEASSPLKKQEMLGVYQRPEIDLFLVFCRKFSITSPFTLKIGYSIPKNYFIGMNQMLEEEEEFSVTPFEVEGTVDYKRLIEKFGVTPISEELEKHIKQVIGDHYMIRRRYFFAHRDLEKILEDHKKGKEFYLYTGRGPSGKTHLGHLAPWVFTQWLQEKTGTHLIFQITDDEKFLTKDMDMDHIKEYTKENILDIIALGFDPKKTEILVDTWNANSLYPEAIKVAKRINFSTIQNAFGFKTSDNIGKIWFTAMQSAPSFLESKRKDKKVRCLIPLGVDQDPHFRLTRDVAPKLGYPKPSILHAKLLPALQKGKKMSSSQPKTAIFTTDTPSEVEEKIYEAFTGGRGTAKEQKELGGEPEICPIFLYEYYLLEPEDKKVKEIKQECKKGELLCGTHKQNFIEKVKNFLERHQERREKAKDKLDEFLVND